MLSINTNLSSLITQHSMKSATQLLNQAVERMTTGYKINHAKDNAANYSISQKMNMQISSYDVAADNVAMGMDLVTTASDIISNMQDKANRLQSLCTQARNGTYGASSMAAINSEAAAIMAEINRLYSTAEYNNISLFNNKAYEIDPSLPKAGASGFIDETGLIATAAVAPTAKAEYNGFIEDPKTYTDAEVAAMTRFADVNSFTSGQKYSISSAEELAKLATLVNSGNTAENVTFVLAEDIDLSAYSSGEGWTPIGTASNTFMGSFDGNGHTISNLTINRPSANNQGLFGYIGAGPDTNNITIQNLKITNANVKCNNRSGILIGEVNSWLAPHTINNNSISGNIIAEGSDIGQLCGLWASGTGPSITNNYCTGSITAKGSGIGGFLGSLDIGGSADLTNCYSGVNVTGNRCVGGFVGYITNKTNISNSYSTGSVIGAEYVGGLLGDGSYAGIVNSYSTGKITGTLDVGGLVGYGSYIEMENSYATGDITGNNDIGGLIGGAGLGTSIENCYTTGNIVGNDNIGGLTGRGYQISILNSYYSGNIVGNDNVGGICGYDQYGDGYINCYAAGSIKGNNKVGGIIGISDSPISYAGNVILENCSSYIQKINGNAGVGCIVGGFVGEEINGAYPKNELKITNCNSILDLSVIGDYYGYDETNDAYILNPDYDTSIYDSFVSFVPFKNVMTTLQVGINSDSSNQISFDTNFELNFDSLGDLTSDDALASIMNFQALLSDKATALGAVENRLQSALESIEVNIENLTSSLSTIRDADIAEVSSEYIRQQILQQASATLMATANQSPAIALQLI